MDEPTEGLLALSKLDRAVLHQRQGFVGKMMAWLYGILSFFLLVFVARDIFVYREFDLQNTKDILWGGLFVGASMAATHAALALYERKIARALRADLVAGKKIRETGSVDSVQEGAENEPTRFQLRHLDGKIQEFVLSSISDLIRIKPAPMLGKRVEIEYAPISRTVLRLRPLS